MCVQIGNRPWPAHGLFGGLPEVRGHEQGLLVFAVLDVLEVIHLPPDDAEEFVLQEHLLDCRVQGLYVVMVAVFLAHRISPGKEWGPGFLPAPAVSCCCVVPDYWP